MSCVITIYRLENFRDEQDWESAWKIVKQGYGTEAVCSQVIQFNEGVDEIITLLSNSLSSKTAISEVLKEESMYMSTHAFVQPQNGDAVFGINITGLAE